MSFEGSNVIANQSFTGVHSDNYLIFSDDCLTSISIIGENLNNLTKRLEEFRHTDELLEKFKDEAELLGEFGDTVEFLEAEEAERIKELKEIQYQIERLTKQIDSISKISKEEAVKSDILSLNNEIALLNTQCHFHLEKLEKRGKTQENSCTTMILYPGENYSYNNFLYDHTVKSVMNNIEELDEQVKILSDCFKRLPNLEVGIMNQKHLVVDINSRTHATKSAQEIGFKLVKLQKELDAVSFGKALESRTELSHTTISLLKGELFLYLQKVEKSILQAAADVRNIQSALFTGADEEKFGEDYAAFLREERLRNE